MSGRPNKRPVSEVAIEAAPIALRVKPQHVGLSIRADANVLIWCLRTLGYCQQSNSIYKLAKGHGSSSEFDDLMVACSSLDMPESIVDVVGLSQHAPKLIKQIQSIALPPGATELSINAMSERCSMTSAEQSMLLFSITIHENELLENVIDHFLNKLNTGRMFRALAYVLDESVNDVQAALRADGFLAKAGMLSLDAIPLVGFAVRLDIGHGLVEAFERASGDWGEIVNKVCARARPSSLVERDFAHISNEWSLVLGYIKGAASAGRVGANVLLHGPPGCGKTEFARAVLAASSLQSFELYSEQPDGKSISPAGRRSYYRQANLYLQHESHSVLLIDEMDGMLEIDEFNLSSRNRGGNWSKASANAQLESNQVPSIWITNNPCQLDSAQLRRFDLVIQFNHLSRQSLRLQLGDKLAPYGLTNAWMDATSAAPGLTPGLVKTLSLVAESIKQSNTGALSMEEMLNTTLRQRGIRASRKKPQKYRMEYCNASMQADVLTAALVAKEDARCLLHGSTGTGKTAYARHIAETLGLEPLLISPSDILDPYVGGTERNIAVLFEHTDPEETLIILDEFESFAADRTGAARNWMVSQVNELLTQLEAYEGRVLACTNLVDCIDPAIRRRFQLKVELLPLNEGQRMNLFKESCRKLGLNVNSDFSLPEQVNGLEQLAYGHIANAVEVAEYIPDLTPESFAVLLKQEVEATNGRVVRPIGFMQ